MYFEVFYSRLFNPLEDFRPDLFVMRLILGD